MTTHVNLITPYEEWCQSEVNWLQLLEQRKMITTTIVISIIIHTLFFIRFTGLQNEHDISKKISHSLEIVLTKVTPEQPPAEEVIIPPEPPVQQKIQKPEPVKTVESSTEKIIDDQIIEEEPIEKPEEKPVTQAASQPLNRPVDPALVSSEKAQYLKRIAAHLDKHKFYPRSARRRHIEGEVKVSFDLLLDGQISNLLTFTGHPMLQQATSDSIYDALPLPKRPESLLSLDTIKIEYAMQFSLK